MNDSAIDKTINDYLVTSAGISAELLTDPERKVADLGLDSLGVIELLFEVEDQYGVHVDDPMILKDMTLAEVYSLVTDLMVQKEAKLAAKAEAAKAQSAGA